MRNDAEEDLFADLSVENECSRKRSKKESWWDMYNAYLLTEEWQRRRQAVLIRDHHLCQACLQRRAQHVHHLTYTHVTREPLFQLIAVCKDCHDSIHNKSVEVKDDSEDLFQ